MSIGYIPSTTIVYWMKEIEGTTDPNDLKSAVRLVRAIDDEYVKSYRRKANSQNKTKNTTDEI